MIRRAPVVDLARERRVRDTLNELRDLVADKPGLAARTRAMLAGDLPCPDLEDSMPTHDTAVNLRLPTALLKRAEDLAPAVAEDPMLLAAGRVVSRATVLRLAIVRGLDAMEAEHRRPKAKAARK